MACRAFFGLFAIWTTLVVHNTMAAPITSFSLSGGAETGEYYMDIMLGNPPQNLSVQIDTGVSGIAVPSLECVRSRPPASTSCIRGYNSTHSFTYNPILCGQPPSSYCDSCSVAGVCQFRYTFLDGTMILGSYVTDSLLFEGLTFDNITFQTFDAASSKFQPTEIDGILGLGPPQNGPMSSVFDRWSSVPGTPKVFSLCLGEFGGQMVFGGSNPSFIGGDLMTVTLLEDSSLQSDPQYAIEVRDVTVAGTSVMPPKTPTTTTTNAFLSTSDQYLQVPTNVFESIRSTFENIFCPKIGQNDISVGGVGGIVGVCGKQTFFEGYCFVLEDDVFSLFPDIALVLNDQVSLVLPPSNYFVDFQGRSCLALERSSQPSIIIGTRIMQEYYTIYQRDQRKVSFAKAANCSGALYTASYMSGDAQSNTVGKTLSHPFALRVTSINDGQPVAGLQIRFAVVDMVTESGVWSGSSFGEAYGHLSPEVAITDSNGVAQTYLTLGSKTGKVVVSADIPLCLNHVVFSANAQLSVVWPVMWCLSIAALLVALGALNWWHIQTKNLRGQMRTNIMGPDSHELETGPSRDKKEDYSSDEEGDSEGDPDGEGGRMLPGRVKRPTSSSRFSWKSIQKWWRKMRRASYEKMIN
eukprot:TRINITY_DN1132_c0_g1_i4.p1 TRINITY_DN1132_c0_g1~~TRINITY_DN1132_c0_g1_i4.p1  ORF type:complete len:636 (+),score=130.52 TRINITY_DN1132_c0_g1_i4:39-1946(+)